jgi:hypothetical protein
VKLPLNKAVKVKVKAKPSAGANSAILRVDDRSTLGLDGYVPATVVASSGLTAPTFGRTVSGRVQRFSSRTYFVTVPAGASALTVSLSGLAAGSQTRFTAFHPYGVPIDSTSSLDCYTNRPVGGPCNPQVRSYPDPTPGVWEISVEARRTTPFLENPFTLTAEIQGVTVDPATTVLDRVQLGRDVPLTWQLTNRLAPVTVTGRGGPLGSAHEARGSIATNEVDTYSVSVPAGASRLDVAIDNPSDLGADLDLYVFRNGTLVGQSADGDSDESVTLPNPAAGDYTVEVDGYDVPAGTTTYDYRDAYYSTALGTLEVDQDEQALGNGATGQLSGSLTASAAPPAGRSLTGRVDVVDVDTDAVLGSALVVVKQVDQG